jgi:alpha-mannosidase
MKKMDVTASKVILCTTPHLDWDWILPFTALCSNIPPYDIDGFTYFNGGGDAFTIFSQATDLLAPNGTPNPAYFYSICEMGFLKAFTDANPQIAGVLKQAAANVEILGGGITSPDSLLPHGEAFIRNYLTGATWVQQAYGLFPKHAYVPDDFGHDSQLPVMLAAMGLQGVAFERVPGGEPTNIPPLQGQGPSPAQWMTENGTEFVWGARDGSTAIAHWLMAGYGQGSKLDPSNALSQIQTYIDANAPSSVTPTLYVPVGTDFALPTDTASCVEIWNQQSGSPVTAVAGTFDDFIQAVVGSGLLGAPQPFRAQPYYSGCYQTRPRLKRLHNDATRALLGAEIFGVIAGARNVQTCAPAWTVELQARTSALREAWLGLVPSTHHDFITGTAADYVYRGEQLPRLTAARTGANGLRRDAMREIAAQVTAAPMAEERTAVVFNQLGFQRGGLVELTVLPELNPNAFNSVRTPGGSAAAQVSAEGGLLFQATCESLGYTTCYLSPNVVQPALQATITTLDGGASYTLANSLISVDVSAASMWAIDAVRDLASSNPQANVLGGTSNQVGFYLDAAGNNYRYTSEQSTSSPPLELDTAVTTVVTGAVQVLETGPLRVRLRARITCTVAGTDYPYTLEYLLAADEPFVRLRTTGACPFGYSAMTMFQLSAPIDAIAQGTPYHWDDAVQVRYWAGPSMQATHDFLIPETTTGAPLCAIYHAAMPAWGQGAQSSPLLVGGLARNPGSNYFGWCPIPAPPGGIDPDVHTLEYAFRVPTGITVDGEGKADPSDGAQLIEALGYTTPLLALVAPVNSTQQLPASISLASVSAASGASTPILTAAKPSEADPGSLILRTYQPSNASMDVTVSLAGLQALGASVNGASLVTALEQTISQGQSPTVTGADIAFTADLALATLKVGWTA